MDCYLWKCFFVHFQGACEIDNRLMLFTLVIDLSTIAFSKQRVNQGLNIGEVGSLQTAEPPEEEVFHLQLIFQINKVLSIKIDPRPI